MTAAEAKEFVISRILDEARRQSTSLCDTEKEMLYWTEAHPEPHISDLKDLAARFDAECDSDEYERKVKALAKAASDHDSADSPTQAQRWTDAIKALSKEDHYINVMLPGFDSTGEVSGQSHRTRDFILYFGIAILVVIGILLYAEFGPK